MPLSGLFLRTARLALILLVTLAVISVVITWRDLHIDTDLQSLTPAMSADPVVTDAINTMSRIAGGQFRLVLTHADPGALDDASAALQDRVAAHADMLVPADQGDVLDAYLALLAEQPFGFLTEGAQTAIEQHPDGQLRHAAMARLYGSGGALRLLPPVQDPMGLVNEYALQAMARLSGDSAGRGQTEIGNEALFFDVHDFSMVDNKLDLSGQSGLTALIANLEAGIEAEWPGIRFLHSGVVFFAADAAGKARQDVSIITTGSALGALLILLLAFRHLYAVVLPLVSIVSGVLFAFIICQALFGGLHVFTLVFGASLIGVLIDYSLHYFYFHGHWNPGGRGGDQRLHRALLLSLCTSVIGYSALSASGLATLQQVAVFSACGLVFGWLVVVSLGPRLVRGVAVRDAWLTAGVNFVLRRFSAVPNRYWLFGGLPLILILLTGSRFALISNDSPRALFNANPQLAQEEQLVSQLLNDYEPGSFILVRQHDAQAVYDQIEKLEQEFGALPGVHHFFPSPANARHAHALNRRLYGEQGVALDFMREQGFADDAVITLNGRYNRSSPEWVSPTAFFQAHRDQLPPLWREVDGQISSFLLVPKALDKAELRAAVELMPDVTYISAVEEATTALRELRLSALGLLAAAVVLIFGVIFLRYRQPFFALQLVIVPAGAVAGTLLCFATLQIPMTLFHVMALFLVLGLGMDYVIFVAEMDGQTQKTMAAVVLSASTSLLSFGLLSISSLPAVSGFGLTVLIGNTLNLLGCLLLASRPRIMRQTVPA